VPATADDFRAKTLRSDTKTFQDLIGNQAFGPTLQIHFAGE
jgi:hypothetical protein